MPLGVRRSPHRRWPLGRIALLAALLLPVAVLSSGAGTRATAAPASAASLKAQLEQLNRKSDQLVEEYLQSKLALERIRKTNADLRQQAAGAERDLRTLQSRLGARAAAAYIQGAGNTLAAVLGSDDPVTAIDRVQVLDLLASQDGDLMDRLEVAGQSWQARKHDLAAAEREQAAEVARLDAKKAEVERAVTRTKSLLRQLEARSAAPATSAPVSAPPAPGGSGAAAAAVRFALAQVGKPYCYGGGGPGCYDCSGLTMAAYATVGISLPHSSSAQYGVGRHISASELQPGDLIFYYSPISHVSMYIGNGQRVSATHSGDYVRVQSLGSSIVGYTRVTG